jgi:hypothetical protein
MSHCARVHGVCTERSVYVSRNESAVGRWERGHPQNRVQHAGARPVRSGRERRVLKGRAASTIAPNGCSERKAGADG